MRNRMMRRKKRRQRRKLICRILITVVSILTSVVIVIGCIWFYLISGIKKTDVISNETGFSTADETLEGETGTILMKKNYSNEKDIFTGMKNTGDTQ